MITAVAVVMVQVRQATLDTLATPEAQAEWDAWRNSRPNQPDAKQPVLRRPPKSPEPPALVLMRDYFGVMLTAAIVFSSLLFAALTFATLGVLGRSRHASTPRLADSAKPQ